MGGEPLLLADSDVTFGISQPNSAGLWEFVEQTVPDAPVNAVRVTGRRVDDSPSGPVPMLFHGLFESTNFQPVMSGTATLEGRQYALALDYSTSMLFPTSEEYWPESWPKKRHTHDFSEGSAVEEEVLPKAHLSRFNDMRIAVHGFLDVLEETAESELVSVGFIASGPPVASVSEYQQIRTKMDQYFPIARPKKNLSNIGKGMYQAADEVTRRTG